jgi:RNA polymerase sigma factor (sigma-70 family)
MHAFRKRSAGSHAFLVRRTEEPLIPRMEAKARPASTSFEEFFLDTNRDLAGALWLVTRNTHEAEEIAQDAYLKLWERWPKVGAMEDPTGYLYRTAWNIWRSRGRRAGVALRRVVHSIPADEATDGVDSRDVVVKALAALTPRERAALVFVHLLDMTSGEAGGVLGIRPSTVRVLAARARARLKEGMQP